MVTIDCVSSLHPMYNLTITLLKLADTLLFKAIFLQLCKPQLIINSKKICYQHLTAFPIGLKLWFFVNYLVIVVCIALLPNAFPFGVWCWLFISYLTARRYGNGGISMATCLSACSSQARVLSKRMNGSSWLLTQILFWLILHCFNKTCVSPKYDTSLWNCLKLYTWKNRHGTPMVASVVNIF